MRSTTPSNRPFRNAATVTLLAGTALLTFGVGMSSAAPTAATKRQSFCAAAINIDAIVGSPSNKSEGMAFAARFVPIVATLSANAVPSLAPAMRTITAAFNQTAATGDPSALEGPEFGRAVSKTEAWIHDNCGYQRVNLAATDFKFTGIPAALHAGNTSFRIRNTGKEFHMFIIMRRKDGVNDAVLDILKSGEAATAAKLDEIGEMGIAPGATTGLSSALKPGRYVYVCPVQLGVKHTGPPHFMQGMYGEFTVA